MTTVEERFGAASTPPGKTGAIDAMRFWFDEIERRAFRATRGLTDADVNADPGHGAMTIGQLLNHHNGLIRAAGETLKPGSMADLPAAEKPVSWNLEDLCKRRDALDDRLRAVFDTVPPDTLMEKRPDMKPDAWRDMPAFARVIRFLNDMAHHTGQVIYARRELGRPVDK